MHKLVLLRHGESQWNLENRFTGWHDVNLTEQGEREGREAGRLLKAEGFEFDMAYCSVLTPGDSDPLAGTHGNGSGMDSGAPGMAFE